MTAIHLDDTNKIYEIRTFFDRKTLYDQLKNRQRSHTVVFGPPKLESLKINDEKTEKTEKIEKTEKTSEAKTNGIDILSIDWF